MIIRDLVKYVEEHNSEFLDKDLYAIDENGYVVPISNIKLIFVEEDEINWSYTNTDDKLAFVVYTEDQYKNY